MGPEERIAGWLGVACFVITLVLSIGGAWVWAVDAHLSARVGWAWIATTVAASIGAVVFFRASIDAGKDGR